MSIRYLAVADAIALHAEIMHRLGEAAVGLRDEALLDSALMRPQMAAYYEHADLLRQAAVLAIGLAQSQAFVDGNKRLAFAALRAFLALNEVNVEGPPLELARIFEDAGSHPRHAAEDKLEAWLRHHFP